jgi:hypothetical protein
MDDVRYKTVTIADGQSLSDAAQLLPHDGRLAAFITPAGWAANAVTFQASVDGVNYFNVYDEGAEYTCAAVPASAYCRVDMNVFHTARYIKVRSGTAAVPANQAGGDIVTLVMWDM